MRTFNTYYENKKQLGSFIADEDIPNSSSLLIQVFSALNDKSFISSLLTELRSFLPDAVIIGSTTDGEIMDGKVSLGKVVLSFSQFEHTELNIAAIEHEENGYLSGRYLAEKLIGEESKLIISFADGMRTNGEEFLNGISSINSSVKVAGGLAGDNFEFSKTYVFINDRIIEDGAVGVSLNSEHLHVHTNHSFNWYPIGKELTVTKAEGNRVYTIDGKSTVDVYAHYLGEDIKDNLPGIGIEFPLMVKRNGLMMARTMMSKNEDGSLTMAGSLYTGEKVQIGFGSSHGILNKSDSILDELSQEPSEGIFVYSCTARRHFMGDEIESEILPFQTVAPVSGFFTYGEFFTSDKKNLLNQTMTIVSLSESDTVHKITKLNSTQTHSSFSVSFDALTHLVNVTREELEESIEVNEKLKERMELALLGSNDGVWDWNILENTVYFSPRWKEMLGYQDKELANSVENWSDRIHPDDKDKAWEDVYKNVNKETEFYENIHRLKHKDGHWVWILDRGKTQFDENGNAVRMIGTHTDITLEKEQQFKHMYQGQIIEQIHDSLVTTDLLGNITSWNLGSENTFGYSESEAIGKNISMLYQEKDRPTLKEYIPILMNTGMYEGEIDLVKKSGELVPISFSLSLLRDENGTPIGIVGINKDDTKRKKIEAALHEQKNILHHQALHDALTGLPNRVLFKDRLAHSIKFAQRHQSGLAVFFIDLDKFKHINDSLGHDVGDSVLIAVGKRIEGVIRKEDTLARLGGDEFTIIMDELKQPEDAKHLANKILKVLAEPLYIDEHILYVTGSIGISLYPQDSDNAQYLLKFSDTAMYKAKEAGRNHIEFYSSEMTKNAFEHMMMKVALQQAIENDELIIHYQPQINTHTNKLVGIEALVRWRHPTKGLLYPDDFMPLAEETALILKIDKWVMKTAMKQVAKWYGDGLTPGILAVNLSVKQLECGDYPKKIQQRLKKYHFDPRWLELEITEGQMMKKPEEVITKLKQISNLGVQISIDDFGTGYSSLQLLKRLPIHRLKIDRSFIKDIPHDEEDVAIVKAIIALAESLNLEIIAEGVESKVQKDYLIAYGCVHVQGHYYSKPIPVQEMKKMLLKDRAI